MTDDEHIGIIVGVVVGAFIVVGVISIILYCHCRKPSRKRNQILSCSERNGSHLTRPNPIKLDNYNKVPPILFPVMKHPDPTSQGTLPKVGSSGLWLTRTSMVGPTPSLGYGPTQPHNISHAALLRATSEPRLAGQPASMYENNMRVYHSQQMPPLFEMYEPWQTRDVMSIDSANYDRAYPKHYAPAQPTVLRDPYLPEPTMFQRSDLRRSISDTGNTSDALPRHHRHMSPPPTPSRPQHRSKPFREIVQVHQTTDPRASRYIGQHCYDRPSSYNENFIFRENRSQSYAHGLDKMNNSTTHARPERSLLVGNRLSQSTMALPAAEYVQQRIEKGGYSNYGFKNSQTVNEVLKNGGEQNGTQTTVTSGYDSARSNLVLDNRTSNYNSDNQETKDQRDTYNDDDDFINNNVDSLQKLASSYSIEPSSSDHTDIEAKHVTTTAFQFLENYLDDDDESVSGSDLMDKHRDTRSAST